VLLARKGGKGFVKIFYSRSTGRLLRRTEIAGALAACFLGVSPLAWAQTSACDLNADGVINNTDFNLANGMALGNPVCTANVEAHLVCTVITVQRVYNSYHGQPCIVYNAHAANLSWTASTTPNVTYNVYRATAPTGPFTTPLNSSPVSATTFKDTSVSAGQTYYYVVTAVASNGTQSAASSPPVQATIPSP
jgi:hypothetical protein